MRFTRALALVCATFLLLMLSISPGFSKARLIIVFPLRSTPALTAQAKIASQAIVTKLSAIEGYDAQLVPEPKTGTLGATAATAGAEIYVVGQLVASDGGYKIIAGSFSAATEQPIANYTAVLASTGTLPEQPDIKTLLAAAVPAPPVSTQAKLLLVPYELPGSTDPAEPVVSQNLVSGLSGMNVPLVKIAAMDGLDAVVNAAKLCADNAASGILIPDGRFQVTVKPGFMSLTVMSHADFRLDEVACDGSVRWSNVGFGDNTVSGLRPNFADSVAAAYAAAVQRVTAARSTASIPQTPAHPKATASVAPAGLSTYVLVPFDVLGMADERKPDITNTLVTKLQAHHIDLRVAAQMDRLTVVDRAQQLCSTNGAQAIIVPAVRMEQTSATWTNAVPHAVFRLSVLNCAGAMIGAATTQGNFKPAALFFRDPDQAIIDATSDAEESAIAQLFPK